MDSFLAVNKEYFKMGLKSVDILIISQIEEFERNKCTCYITNKQFSEMFGESESTIKRAIDKLEDMGIIKRNTYFIEGNGRANKQRVLSLNNSGKWKVQNEPTKIMEGSNIDNGRFKSEEWKVHNEPIKENKNKNKKKIELAALAPADKWIPKDNKSKEIFGSDIHSDVRVMEILNEEYKADWRGVRKTTEDICNEDWVIVCNVNQDKIVEYIQEVLS